MSSSAQYLLAGLGAADSKSDCLPRPMLVHSLTMQCSFRKPQADFWKRDNATWLKYDWIKTYTTTEATQASEYY